MQAMDCDNEKLLNYLPYLLQDLWELGSSPEDIITLMKRNTNYSKSFSVLDLGCGKGAVSIKLAKEFGCKVHAVDGIESFIDYAKKKAAE